MFKHIWQQLTDKMVDELRRDHLRAITELNNGVQAILYPCKPITRQDTNKRPGKNYQDIAKKVERQNQADEE